MTGQDDRGHTALNHQHTTTNPGHDYFSVLAQPCPHPTGTRIEITGRMPDEPDPVPIGSTGTVTGGNGGQLFVDWDDGRRLIVLVDRDPYRVIGSDSGA